MTRPCYLVIDTEHSASISTRKLVIETAKMNVLTAYSGAEALETLHRFGNIDGIVMDRGVRDIPCTQLLQQMKAIAPGRPVIVIDRPDTPPCDGADYTLHSFMPKELLALLQRLLPEQTKQIELRDEELSKKEQG